MRSYLWNPMFVLFFISSMMVHSKPDKAFSVFEGCTYADQEWADGDSFQVKLPKGDHKTFRLYGVDCFEAKADKRESTMNRLRAQRRYFGLSQYGGSAETSVKLAVAYGMKAKKRVAELLAKPFTVHTAFAQAQGRSKYQRFYAYITLSDGQDLGEVLVAEGLARVYGMYRADSEERTKELYKAKLRDKELICARAGKGAWEHTDWEKLAQERLAERNEKLEIKEIIDGINKDKKIRPVNPNTADLRSLMQLPNIGQIKANAIILERENGLFLRAEDLKRVKGIGYATVKKLKPFLFFQE